MFVSNQRRRVATGPVSITQHQTLTSSLVHYYTVDELSGSRLDSVGSLDLSPFGTPSTAGGMHGNCIDCDGVDDYLYNASLMSLSGDYTVSAWVEADSISGYNSYWGAAIIRSHGDGFSDGQYAVKCMPSGALRFYDGALYYQTADAVIGLAAWQHLVCVRSGSDRLIYVDNVPLSYVTTGSSAGSWGSYTAIGRGYSSAGHYWDGKIDELGVWDRALSESEIADLYNSGNGIPYE